MPANTETYPQQFAKEIEINALPAEVWAALTQPELMQQWMAETPVEITTDWVPGSSVVMRGPWYKTGFENRGTVMANEPGELLSYTHLSSLSRLPDAEENYAVLEFRLEQVSERTTKLFFSARRFATSAIYHHLAFYWNVTLHKIKKQVEKQT